MIYYASHSNTSRVICRRLRSPYEVHGDIKQSTVYFLLGEDSSSEHLRHYFYYFYRYFILCYFCEELTEIFDLLR